MPAFVGTVHALVDPGSPEASIPEGKSSAIVASRRAIWRLVGDVKLYDGGSDGLAASTGDNKLFAVGGLFFP